MIKEAIETVLRDGDIKKAILDYLKSITAQPKEEWQEIYRCQSEARSRHVELDLHTGMENFERDYRLYMRVYYNRSGGVGRVVFFEDDARLFDSSHNPYFMDFDYRRTDDTALLAEHNPFAVIDHALKLWPERKTAFEGTAAE